MKDELNSYFGEGINMRGVLKFRGALRFDGNFQGEIVTDDTLIVGKTAKLEAKISLGSLFNMGFIKGDVRASKRVSIFADSRLDGNLDTPTLISEEGAQFTGSCTMPSEKRAVKPSKKEPGLKTGMAQNYPEKMRDAAQVSVKPVVRQSAGSKPKSRKKIFTAAAVTLLVALGSGTAYMINNWKTTVGEYPLSRYVYEKFAQNADYKLAVLGDIYFNEKKYKDAARVYLRMKELSKNDFSRTNRLATSLEMGGHTGEAVSYMEDALYKNGYDPELADRLKQYYINEKKVANLISLQELMVANNQSDMEMTRKLFELYEDNDRLEEALNIYVSKLASSPMTVKDIAQVGRLEKDLDRMDDAIKTFTKLVAVSPREIDGHLELAYLYHKTGLEAKAVQEFYKAARIDPKNVEAINNKGFIKLSRNLSAKAIEYFNLALAEDDKNLRSFLGLATTYSKLGNGEKAELYCKKILEIDPSYSPALNRLAWVYARDNKNLDEAEEYSLASMKYNQDLPDYLDTLSEVYYRKKEYKKAVDQMRRALEARPNNRYYQSQMRKFLAALKRFDPKTYAEIKQKKQIKQNVKEQAKQKAVADALEKEKLEAKRKQEAKAVADKIAEREAEIQKQARKNAERQAALKAEQAAQPQAESKPKKVPNETATEPVGENIAPPEDNTEAVDTEAVGEQKQ
ncbi:MAG: polymer-forming cytoskeletal protein [Nitrospinota bacterium]